MSCHTNMSFIQLILIEKFFGKIQSKFWKEAKFVDFNDIIMFHLLNLLRV